ncbi:MAG TPA: MFS transporter [Microbacterium sp.]|nr:MFS transporter [Microbacterium sp.]HBR89947.1 MFS transporter [Microbacterium sp.]|tara:strand:+ start:271 stop:1554 length:1284 start_codon:yes stop_codon:yes gene_type:complete
MPKAAQQSPMRTFLVSGVGTALEFYDFLIYGLAAALVFGTVFFPSENPMIGVLLGFASFGTGFLARPLGGIVIGHFGDRIGRRAMLVLTLIVMGVCTFAIGCLPGYETIGIAAPIILVLLRLVQGFAAGGEWGGAALFGIERAPEGRRGLWGSFTSMGIGLGSLLGVFVFAVTSAAFGGDLAEFAWRIPFWIGGIVVVIGLVARLIVMEDDAPHSPEPSSSSLPIVQVLRTRPKALLLSVGISYGYNTLAYVGFTFLLSYVTQFGFDQTQSLIAQLVYCAVLFATAPIAAVVSDRIGRKPTMIGGAVLGGAMLFAFFAIVQNKSVGALILGFALAGITTAITQGPIPAFLGEQFPKQMRYSGVSAGYQVGAAIGGGTAAFIATALLIAFDSNPLSVALYGAFAMLVLAVCSLAARETAHLSTDSLDH